MCDVRVCDVRGACLCVIIVVGPGVAVRGPESRDWGGCVQDHGHGGTGGTCVWPGETPVLGILVQNLEGAVGWGAICGSPGSGRGVGREEGVRVCPGTWNVLNNRTPNDGVRGWG